MSVSTQFYLDQAAECGRNAQRATLQNQREVQLKAQAAWQAMAERAIKTAAERDRRDAERREQAGLAPEPARDHQRGVPVDHRARGRDLRRARGPRPRRRGQRRRACAHFRVEPIRPTDDEPKRLAPGIPRFADKPGEGFAIDSAAAFVEGDEDRIIREQRAQFRAFALPTPPSRSSGLEHLFRRRSVARLART